jgi:hypothetical protein
MLVELCYYIRSNILHLMCNSLYDIVIDPIIGNGFYHILIDFNYIDCN